MKIVTWNCNGGLRKKLGQLLALEADIYIVQECEDPSRSTDSGYAAFAANSLWVGKNRHKGLGVFAGENHVLNLLDWESGSLELFLPCRIDDRITLLALWACHANSPTFGYIGQVWKYLEQHKSKVHKMQTIIAGDFNSNARWDKWDRWWNHSDVVTELEKLNIRSQYHHVRREQQGYETIPTFFMYRKQSKPYHIDYVFLSDDLLADSESSIGVPDDWLELSDHMPFICDIYNL